MIFVETSVLIASWQETHTHHQQSFDLVQSLSSTIACTSIHCVVEMFSVMTRMPPPLRVSSSEAMRLVDQTRTLLSVLSLDTTKAFEALNSFVERNLGGGMVYDAMILACARNADSQKIYTWNKKHFDKIAPDLCDRIMLP